MSEILQVVKLKLLLLLYKGKLLQEISRMLTYFTDSEQIYKLVFFRPKYLYLYNKIVYCYDSKLLDQDFFRLCCEMLCCFAIDLL